MGAARLILQTVACLICAVTPLLAQTGGEQIELLPLNPKALVMRDFSGQAPVPVLVLPQGTPVCLEFIDYITTRAAKRNDRMRFRVVSEVRVEGLTIIPNGSDASGIVTVAKKPRHFSPDGKLEISLQSITLLNGQTLAIGSPAFCKQCGKWDLRAPDSLQAPLLSLLAPGMLAVMPKEDRLDVLKSIISKGEQDVRYPGTRANAVISAAVELNKEEFRKLQSAAPRQAP